MNHQTSQRHYVRLATRGVLLAAMAASPCWAQDAAAVAAAPPAAQPEAPAPTPMQQSLEGQTVVTPEAQAVLDRMTASLTGMREFEVTGEITRDEVLSYGYKIQHSEHAKLQVRKPNGLRSEVTGDIKTRTYVYDGKTLTTYAPDAKAYSTGEAPASLGELVSTLLDAGIEMPLIDMLYNGTAGNLTEEVRVGILVGDSMVDGVATDHLAFRQPDIDWQLWVEKGQRALPRKIVITTRYAVGDPQYTAVLRWNTAPKFDAATFTLVPPAGATKIPYRTKLVAEKGEAK
jgi:hypothetical protein